MFARFTILPAGVLASGLLIAGPCTPAGPSAEPSGGPSTSSGVRFALRVGAGAARPVYVR